MTDEEKLRDIVRKAAAFSLPSNTQEFHLDMFTSSLMASGVKIGKNTNVPRWIPVTERLPEPETEVLAYRGGFIGNMMDVYTYLRVDVWQDTYGYTESTNGEGITHWMPLPQPPKDGDEGRRLIDADALWEKAYWHGKLPDVDDPFGDGVEAVDWKDIDEAPTVDAVELPCKIGDVVWAVSYFRGKWRPKQGIVSEMFFIKEKDMELQIGVKNIVRGKWGEKVFATYEEAEEQIERNNRKD